ncbi:hypothetical protein EPUL_000332, partial [Erysiphe pulchra]
TLFDQLARVAFHQYILWAIGDAVVSTVIRLIFYAILAIRLLAGGVLLGFTRPEFSPTCVARRSNIIGSVLVLALDGVIVMILATRLFVVVKRQDKSNVSIQVKAKERALSFGIFGFMIWTGTGAPMILGFPEFILLLKTLLPAVGILIIIGIITLFPGYFVSQSQEVASTTGALSPYMGPVFPSQNAVKASAGSPSSGYMQSRSLYVVNPSTPHDSPTPFGSGRGIMKNNETTPINSVVNMSGNNDSVMTFLNNAKLRKNSANDSSQSLGSYTPGYRGSSGIFPPQGNNQAALAPAIVGESGPNAVATSSPGTQLLGKRNILKWPLKTSPEKQSIRNLPISNPISIDQKENDLDYFVRIPTVELEQAILNERQRRDAEAAKSYLLANPLTRKPSTLLRGNLESTDENSPTKQMTKMTMDISSPNDDKEMKIHSSQTDELVTASVVNINQDTKTAPILTPKSPIHFDKKVPDYIYETSRTTSILPSPIPDELRRRSPINKANLSSPVKSTLALSPKSFTQPIQNSQNLQQQELLGTENNGARSTSTQRIMLVNEIIYDRPDIIKNIMKDLSGENSGLLRGYSDIMEEYPEMLEKYPDTPGVNQIDMKKQIHCTKIDEPVNLPSIIDRPRPIQRRISTIISSGRRRSKSLGAIKSRATMAESSTIDYDLLPLPPPLPTRAANLKRLLHGDTNDMAREEERMKYLFPAPPMTPRIVNRHKRILSLPSLAQMPSFQRLDSDIFNLDESSKIRMKLGEFKKVSEFVNESSELTYQNTLNSHQDQSQVNRGSLVHEKFDVPPNASKLSSFFAKAPEQISTYNENVHNYQSSTNQTPIEDDTIDWDWLAELDPLETPKNHSPPTANTSVVNERDSQGLSFNLKSEYQEIVTVMLETPIQKNSEWSRNKLPAAMLKPGGDSQLSSTNKKEMKVSSAKVNHKSRRKIAEARDSWYCRVGERMSSFSGKRNDVLQTNKIPPPLLLDRNEIATIPKIQYPELTPPHHSFESADSGIRSPLSRLEEKKKGSIELLMQKFPKIVPTGNGTEIPLLKTLEMEMEEQSNQWQHLQNNLDRDSFISILSQLPIESLQSSKKILESSDVGDNLGPRASHLSTLSNISNELSTDTWQQQLAEAQISYADLYNQRPNHFKFSNYQVLTPTPPESIDSENDNISQFEDEDETPRQSSINLLSTDNSLWRPTFPSNHERYNSMWNPSDLSSMFIDTMPPAADLRPPKRYTEQGLSIKSHSLWFKKFKDGRKVQSSNSWLSKIEGQEIHQSPEEEFNNFEQVDMIPDSHGKDKAHVNSMGSKCEDMENFSEFEEKFDESTLLKIAALLKTDNLPSNKSLLPPRQKHHLESQYDDFPKDELPKPVSILPLKINENFSAPDTKDTQVNKSPAIVNKGVSKDENINQLLEAREVSSDTPHFKTEEISESMLWNHEYCTIQSVGLLQPSPETWRALNIMPERAYRSKSRKLDNNLPKFEFNKLWVKPQEKLQAQEVTGMWVNYQNFSTMKSIEIAIEKTFCSKLWNQVNSENSIIRSIGLHQPSPKAWRALITTLKDAPRSKPRIPDSNLPIIKTQSLWTKPKYTSLAQEISATWDRSRSLVTGDNSGKKSHISIGEIDTQFTLDHQIVKPQINQKPVANINIEVSNCIFKLNYRAKKAYDKQKQDLLVNDAENTFKSKKDLQVTKITNEVGERSQFKTNGIIFESMLWSPGRYSDIAYESFGLQQPSSDVWEAFTVISESSSWSKPKQIDASLPKFATEKLWAKKQQVLTPEYEASVMWTIKHNSQTEDTYNVKSAINLNEKMVYSKLWTKKHPVDLVILSVGLQQPSTEVWRALNSMPEKLSKSKPRISKCRLQILKTGNLWVKKQQDKEQKQKANAMWTNEKILVTREKSEVKSVANSQEKTFNTMLWTKDHSFIINTRSIGLQQPSPEVWRALNFMPKQFSQSKPRVSKSSLPMLKSNNLWAKQQIVKTEMDNINGIWKNEKKPETQDISTIGKSQVNFTEKTFDTMLWKKKNPLDLVIRSVGLQQTSSEVWRALTIMPEKRPQFKPRVPEGSLPIFKSDNLWVKQRQVDTKNNDTSGMWTNEKVLETRESPEVKSAVNSQEKTIQFNSMLWTQTYPLNITARIFGIQQPSPEVWRALTIMPEKRSQSNPRVFEGSLQILKTNNLWAKQIQAKPKTNDTSGIWKNEKNLGTQDLSKVKSRINFTEKTLNSTLWTSRNHENIDIRVFGLQQPSAEAWGVFKYISEDLPRSKLKKTDNDFISLEKDRLRSLHLNSTKLWSLSKNSKEAINWISRCCLMQDKKSDSELTSEIKNYLWKKKTVTSKTSFIGINKLSNFRASIYQTGAISNAASTTYKSNYPRLPLDQLTSKKLWEKTIKIPIQRDWISESSVRPESPTFSTSSSLPSSPISDASSIFSISTKASSIWAVQEMPNHHYMYPFISEGNPLELKPIYDGHRVSKSSIGPKLARPTPLAAVLEATQQFSQNSRKTEDNQTPKHPVSKSKKYWKIAASETIKETSSLSKSKSKNPLTRTFAASPAEWKLALTEAILAGNTKT